MITQDHGHLAFRAAEPPDSPQSVTSRHRRRRTHRLTSKTHLACTTVDVHAGGDHDIIVGEVVHLSVAEQRPEPLVFFEGVLGTLRDGPPDPEPAAAGSATDDAHGGGPDA